MVGFPSAYLGDRSSQGSYAHRFYLLFRVCPLNSGFLVRWSGSHGSLTVVGTSKSLMQAQHSICAFRCSPIALATPNCFLWAPLFINLFPHSRSLLIHLLLDAPPSHHSCNGVRAHTGDCFSHPWVHPRLLCPHSLW